MTRKTMNRITRVWFTACTIISLFLSHKEYVDKDMWLMWFWLFIAVLCGASHMLASSERVE